MVSKGTCRDAGFTLIELVVVVTIIAVLSALTAPAFTQLVAAQRIKGASSDLLSALTRARSEAIKRNTEVTLAPASAGQWQQGWRIPNPADTGNVLDDHGPLALLQVSGPDSIVYLANGRLKNAVAPAFQVSATGQTTVRCVRIDLSGRPQQTAAACP
ncbi:MAG: GspH/FimT family pseudopilin [Pseudomonadota bacterium]|nr:GspH/FimT family pseudopilin [Pseudomonadota bacterium]